MVKRLCLILALTAGMPLHAADPNPPPFGFIEAAIVMDDDPEYARADYDDSGWPVRSWAQVAERDVWWLRRRVQLPQDYLAGDVPVGLYIFGAASAEVWWDGRRVGSKGTVGTRAEREIPGVMDAVIGMPGELLGLGEHVLAVRFSAHHAGSGIVTPVDSVFFAPFGSPLRFFEAQYLPAFVLGGALALATAFLLVLWIREREHDVAWLLLASFAALWQLAFEVSRIFIQYPYPWHEWRLFAIGVAAALGGVGVLGYLLRRFGFRVSRVWLFGAFAIAVALLASGLPIGPVTGLAVLSWLTVGTTVCVLAIRSGHPKGWLVLAALALMLAAMLWDPGAFMDRTYFLGLVLLLLLFFGDTVATHARVRRERDAVRYRSARLELELLKRHLRPHFLMNTLTTLNEWLETEPRVAARMIEALAAEFRLLDRAATRLLIPLEEELALGRAHLEVMSYRQGRRYRLQVEGDTELLIPPAVIHTLLENALTHADPEDRRDRFQLRVSPNGDRVALTLSCPGAPNGASEPAREGTGLGYVRARLREAFGGAASLRSEPAAEGWRTRIEMPLAREPDTHENPTRARSMEPGTAPRP